MATRKSNPVVVSVFDVVAADVDSLMGRILDNWDKLSEKEQDVMADKVSELLDKMGYVQSPTAETISPPVPVLPKLEIPSAPTAKAKCAEILSTITGSPVSAGKDNFWGCGSLTCFLRSLGSAGFTKADGPKIFTFLGISEAVQDNSTFGHIAKNRPGKVIELDKAFVSSIRAGIGSVTPSVVVSPSTPTVQPKSKKTPSVPAQQLATVLPILTSIVPTMEELRVQATALGVKGVHLFKSPEKLAAAIATKGVQVTTPVVPQAQTVSAAAQVTVPVQPVKTDINGQALTGTVQGNTAILNAIGNLDAQERAEFYTLLAREMNRSDARNLLGALARTNKDVLKTMKDEMPK